MSGNKNNNYQPHKKKGITLIRHYVPEEDLTGVSISKADKENGSPKQGDMIARGDDPNDMWLINEAYYKDNYELVPTFDNLRDEAKGY